MSVYSLPATRRETEKYETNSCPVLPRPFVESCDNARNSGSSLGLSHTHTYTYRLTLRAPLSGPLFLLLTMPLKPTQGKQPARDFGVFSSAFPT